MQLIRCTARLLREIGAKPKDLLSETPPFQFLGPWHANLIYIERRKTILFVNDRTLLNFVVPDVPRSQIQELPDLFRSALSCVLSDEAIPENVKSRILAEYNDIGIAKSANRSVLGSSNDLAYHYKRAILEAGGVHSPRVPLIIKKMNRMPLQAIEFKFPIDELGEMYGFAA